MNALQNISIAGENSLIVYFGDAPSESIASEVAATAGQLRTSLGELLIDLVPSYASLLVIYDHFKTDHHAVRAAIRHALARPIESRYQSIRDSGDTAGLLQRRIRTRLANTG